VKKLKIGQYFALAEI